MLAHAPAAFLAAGLLLGLAPAAVAVPSPCNVTADFCLQRKFLSAPDCAERNATYSNATLAAAGYFCCWYQGPFFPPPAIPISAWLLLNDTGDVIDRCLTPGSCVDYYELPEYEKCENN